MPSSKALNFIYSFSEKSDFKYLIRGVQVLKNKLSLFLIVVLLIVLAGCGTDDKSAVTENQSSNDTQQSSSEVTDAIENEKKLETDGKIISTTVAITEITNELELDLVGIPTTYKGLPE